MVHRFKLRITANWTSDVDRVTEARAPLSGTRELILPSDDLSYSAGRAELMLSMKKFDAEHRTSKAQGTREDGEGEYQ
jgi:hypothetical protein